MENLVQSEIVELTAAETEEVEGGVIFAVGLVLVNAAAWGRVAYLLS